VQQKAQCHIKNKDKFTPLQLACQYGRLDVVQVMLKKYVDLLQREMHDADSHFPLMLAARSGHKPVVELLLANGCNINFRVSTCCITAVYSTIKYIH
jgi:ankyrin repeat protein